MSTTTDNVSQNDNQNNNVNNRNYNFDTYEGIESYVLDLCRKKAEEQNRDPSFITPETLLIEIFPDTEEGNVRLAEGVITGEPGRLELMVTAELETQNKAFNLKCDDFFDRALTVASFSLLLLNSRQNASSQDESLQSKFKNFFKSEEGEDDADVNEDDVEVNDDVNEDEVEVA